MYQRVRGGYAIFAPKGGAPSNPASYNNLRALVRATVEVGAESFEVVAREDDFGHGPIWEKERREYPGIAGCGGRTTHRVPAIIFEPVS
jgi:hypothetical protein